MDGIGLGFVILLFGPIVAVAFLGAVLGALIADDGKKKHLALRGFMIGIVVAVLGMPVFYFAPPNAPGDVPLITGDY